MGFSVYGQNVTLFTLDSMKKQSECAQKEPIQIDFYPPLIVIEVAKLKAINKHSVFLRAP